MRFVDLLYEEVVLFLVCGIVDPTGLLNLVLFSLFVPAAPS